MTIENLNSRIGQSNQIENYMFASYSPKPCPLTDMVYCRTFSSQDVNTESALIHGEISKAIVRKSPPMVNNSKSARNKTPLLSPSETKEHKSVKSEQQILNRIDKNILPSNFTNDIPRNILFGVDTRSVVKYS